MDENPSGAFAPLKPSEEFIDTLKMALITPSGLREVVEKLINRSKEGTVGGHSEGQKADGRPVLSLTQDEFVALCQYTLANPIVCEGSATATSPETHVALGKIRVLVARLIATEANTAALELKGASTSDLDGALAEVHFPRLLALCRATRAGIGSSKNSSSGVAVASSFVSVLLIMPPAALTEAFKMPSFVDVVKAVILLGSANSYRRFSLALSKHRRQQQSQSFQPTITHQQIMAEQVLKRAAKKDSLLRQLQNLIRLSAEAREVALQLMGCNTVPEGETGSACLWILSSWCRYCLSRQRRLKPTSLYGTAETQVSEEIRQRTMASALAVKEALLQRLVRVLEGRYAVSTETLFCLAPLVALLSQDDWRQHIEPVATRGLARAFDFAAPPLIFLCRHARADTSACLLQNSEALLSVLASASSLGTGFQHRLALSQQLLGQLVKKCHSLEAPLRVQQQILERVVGPAMKVPDKIALLQAASLCLPTDGGRRLLSREDGARLSRLLSEKNGILNFLVTEANDAVKAACAFFLGGVLPLLLSRGSLEARDDFLHEAVNSLLRFCCCGADSKKLLLNSADQQQLVISSVDALSAIAAAALECGVEVPTLVESAPKLQKLLSACSGKTQLRALALLTSILILQLECIHAVSLPASEREKTRVVPIALFSELLSSSAATYNASKTELLLQLQLHTLLLQRSQNRVSGISELTSSLLDGADDDSELCTAAWKAGSLIASGEADPPGRVFFASLVDCLCAIQQKCRLSPAKAACCAESSAGAAQSLQFLSWRRGLYTDAFVDLVGVAHTEASVLPQLALIFFKLLCRSSWAAVASSRAGAGKWGDLDLNGNATAAKENCVGGETDGSDGSCLSPRTLHRFFAQLLQIAYPPKALFNNDTSHHPVAERGGLNALFVLCAAHPALRFSRRKGVVASCRSVLRSMLRSVQNQVDDDSLRASVDWDQLLSLLPIAASEATCRAAPEDGTGAAGACAGVATAIGTFLCEVKREASSDAALSLGFDSFERGGSRGKDFSNGRLREAASLLDGLVELSVDCCRKLLREIPVQTVETFSREAQALFFAPEGEVFTGLDGKPVSVSLDSTLPVSTQGRSGVATKASSLPRQGGPSARRAVVGFASGSKVAAKPSAGGATRAQQEEEALRQQRLCRLTMKIRQQQCQRAVDFSGSLLLGCGSSDAAEELLASPSVGRVASDGKETQYLLPALESLLRCSITSFAAFQCLEKVVLGCISVQLLPRRALLPDALLAIQLGRDFFKAAADLLSTAHGECILSRAAAALLLPLVAAVLTEAESANAVVCRQALLLLLQQLKLRSPLKPATVVECLAAVLKAHPSLFPSGEEALCLFAEYLLLPEQIQSLVLLAASTTAPGRRAVACALRRSPVNVLQESFRLASTVLRTLAQDPAEALTRQVSVEQLERLLRAGPQETSREGDTRASALESLVEFLAAPSEAFREMAAEALATMVEGEDVKTVSLLLSLLTDVFTGRRAVQGIFMSPHKQPSTAQQQHSQNAPENALVYRKKDLDDDDGFFKTKEANKKGAGRLAAGEESEEAAQMRGSHAISSREDRTLKTGAALTLLLGTAAALKRLAEHGAFQCSGTIVPFITFLVQGGIVSPEAIHDSTLQQLLLAAGVAAVRKIEDPRVRQQLFECLDSCSQNVRSGSDDAVAAAQTAYALFCGCLAEKMQSTDPLLLHISERLKLCLLSPSPTPCDVQRLLSRPFTPLIKLLGEADQLQASQRSAEEGAEGRGGDQGSDAASDKRNESRSLEIVESFFQAALKGDELPIRRGGAFGLAACVRGLGVSSLKKLNILPRIQDALGGRECVERQGALLCVEALSECLGRLFEPYTLNTLGLLLGCLSDRSLPVRTAGQQAARQLMRQLSSHGVRLVLPTLTEKLSDPHWRVKIGSIELLAAMASCAPKQLGTFVHKIVPLLCEVVTDDCLPQVRGATIDALLAIGEAVEAASLRALAPTLVSALANPSSETTRMALDALVSVEIEEKVDSAALSLAVPLLVRAMHERSSETKRRAVDIVGSLALLCQQQQAILPYLPQLLPQLKQALGDTTPVVRASAARACGAIARGVDESELADLLRWLLQKLGESELPVERSGAANCLAELLLAWGPARLKQLLPQLLQKAGDVSASATSREGYLGLFVFLPSAFGMEFQDFVPEVMPVVLASLSAESEGVREVALRASEVCVQMFAATHTALLLRPLEDGLYADDWRIRCSSTQLLGVLLERLLRGCEGLVAAEDLMQTEVLSIERRSFILASLFIVRSDENPAVRQQAAMAWKRVVTHTPRTLKEILPILTRRIISNLATPPGLKQQQQKQRAAARCIGALSQKMGDAVLPQLLPHLDEALKSKDPSTRRGVCLGLIELFRCGSRGALTSNLEYLLTLLSRALHDSDEQVQQMAAAAAAVAIELLGTDATTRLVPPLLTKLLVPPLASREQARETAAARKAQLQGLTLLLKEQPLAVLPLLLKEAAVPQQNASTASVLAAARDVEPSRLARHAQRIFAALLAGCCQQCASDDDAFVLEECFRAAAELLRRLDSAGLDAVIDLVSDEIKSVAPLAEVSAAGRMQLLGASRTSLRGAGTSNSVCNDGETDAAAPDPDAPLTAGLYTRPCFLRANKAFQLASEANPTNAKRREVCACFLLLISVTRTPGELQERQKLLLRLLLPLALADPSAAVGDAAGAALAALLLPLTRECLNDLIPLLYRGLYSLVADPLTNKPVGGSIITLPGFSGSPGGPSNSSVLPAALRETVLPEAPQAAASCSPCASVSAALLAGCLATAPRTREVAARTLELLLLHAEQQQLKPLGIKITGPLIRCIADKLSVSVKAALLRALRALLVKAGACIKALLPQLQATLLKTLAGSSSSVSASAAAAFALARCCLGLVASLHTKARVETLLAELALSINPSAADMASVGAAGSLMPPLTALQAVQHVLLGIPNEVIEGKLLEDLTMACWGAAEDAREEHQLNTACTVLGWVLGRSAHTPEGQRLLRNYIVDAATDYQSETRRSSCLVFASFLQCAQRSRLAEMPLMQNQTLEPLVQNLLQDSSMQVQGAAVAVYRQLVRQSCGNSELLSSCRSLLPSILATVESAASEASTGVGSWSPVSDALVAARRLTAVCASSLNSPPQEGKAWFTAQICELAFSQLFALNPAVKLQAEQLLLQVLRGRAGESGVSEVVADELISDLERCKGTTRLEGRLLQQLFDYIVRVLLRVNQESAADACNAEDSDSEDAPPLNPSQLEPDLRDDNWEIVA